jgi:hypothetical protein
MGADFTTLLAAAKLPERTVQVCLRGDLVAEHEAADRALVEAQRNPSDSKEGNGSGSLIATVERLQAEMRDSTYPFRIRAMDRVAFRALIAAHPPRRTENDEPDAGDVQAGFNRDTYFDALLKASVVDPVLSDEQFADLLSKLTDRQYGDLTDAAWMVNRNEVSVPFSLAASRARRTSADE